MHERPLHIIEEHPSKPRTLVAQIIDGNPCSRSECAFPLDEAIVLADSVNERGISVRNAQRALFEKVMTRCHDGTGSMALSRENTDETFPFCHPHPIRIRENRE